MNESIESIVAEMRREIGDGTDTYCGKRIIRRMEDDRVRQYCDSIEAAWKRQEQCYLDQIRDAVNMIGHERFVKEHAPVGNAAAMREALEEIRVEAMSDYEPDADYLIEKCNAALSAPVRNCDRLKTGEDAKYMFLQIAELPEGNGDADMREWYRKLIAWLFATAERKGEGDGK